MTKAQHTPGPWAIGLGENQNWCNINASGWGSFAKVAVVSGNTPSEEGEANARLIAAAPELLEALEEIKAIASTLIYGDGTFENPAPVTLKTFINICSGAIAKAKGEL